MSDGYSQAICICGESRWSVPPKSEKLYERKVRCSHCKMEWLIKRWSNGRAEMRVLKYNKPYEKGKP